MMDGLQKVFAYQGNQVRTVLKDGEPWFVAKDVCEVLELVDVNRSTFRLNDAMKGTHTVSTPGGSQQMTVISEAGVYKLVFTSRKPEAEQFTDWIATEVIPSIRKHGGYLTQSKIEEVLTDPDTIIRLATDLKTEREKRHRLEIETAQQRQIIHELQPKATYYDLVLQNKTSIPITKIAKDYGMSGQAMNNLLHELGVQYKMDDIWLLYQKYADKGYTQTKTHVIDADNGRMHTYWTQKGRLFIYDLLKSEKEILPLIERDKIA